MSRPPVVALALLNALLLLPAGTVADDEEGLAVAFETSRGTWMGVDLHPAGDRILFDLLGDLYVVPGGGGEATRLTDGPAWDGDARWSPDGSTIVFSSDRGGNRNLWLMDGDGGRVRALTEDPATRYSEPAWTPDGEYVVTRRRYTDTSSIGIHELWLQPVLGGAGVQLTKKEEMGGATEPAVSPDGRFVYFSGRASRYAYNRDPNRGIWQIHRIDRRTGERRPITNDAGGAVRPTPSPDGRTLAVARRAGAATVLDLLDLESGALRRVGDWLDPDEQEGFAINGLHPRMDWFDDGRHLLVSAGGQLWKVDTATGDRVAIPFTAKVEARIQPAVRPRRPAVQDEVRARLIRWPTVSPDGSTLAFGALGSIWRMDLPDGTPARLTRDDVREFGPTLSPDGRTIAYVAFDDEEGGSVRTVSARGGRSKTIGAVGPKYVNPHFSPDGRELVLLRGSGSHERGGSLAWDVWTDVITMDVKTGETEIVTQTSGGKRGAQPRFSPDGARILIPEDRPVDKDAAKGALVSVNRDGTDKRDLISAGNATDIVLSPDGRWAAWTEAHHVWIARLPPLGRQTFALDKNGGSVPTWRLTESTGDWVDFPWGSGAVTWNDGVEVRRMELDALVAWEEERQEQARIEAEAAAAEDQDENEDENENEDEDEDENENEKENENEDDDEDENEDEEDAVPPSDAFTVDLRVPRLVPTGSFAITGATVLTMNGDEVLTGHTVVVRDDRIASVAPDGTVELGPDVHLVDGAGLTVIPGLVDVHAHGHFSANDVMDTEHWPYWANLAYGVTTLHDPSAFSDQVFTYAEMVEAGLMTAPRVFSTGMILYGAAGAWSSHVETAEDALRHVRRMKALGAISVKSYQQPRRDQRQWIVDACRAEGLLDIPEGGGDTWGNLTMVLDGHSAIEHAMPTVPLQEDVVRFFAASDTYYTPTLTVAYGGPSGEFFFYGEGPVWADERLQRFVPAANLAKGRRPAVQITDPAEWRHIRVAQSAAAIARAGGHVTVGGHGQMQGLGTHWEMWALAGEGAMTAAEALRAATIEGARYLGMEDDLGTVEAGKLADLVVLGSDPLEDIRSSADVRYVVRGGELYDAWTMDRLWPEPAPKPTLRWERARDALTGPVLSE